MFVVQCVLPLLLITFASTVIVYEMTKKQSLSYKHKEREQESKKLVKLLTAVSITFAICCTPTHILTIVLEFTGVEESKYIGEIKLAVYILLYSNSALNPILYNVFSSSFRDGLFEIVRRLCGGKTDERFGSLVKNDTIVSRIGSSIRKNRNSKNSIGSSIRSGRKNKNSRTYNIEMNPLRMKSEKRMTNQC